MPERSHYQRADQDKRGRFALGHGSQLGLWQAGC